MHFGFRGFTSEIASMRREAVSQPRHAWLAEHTDQIELFYLSGYSSEPQSGKLLDADLKHINHCKVPAHIKAKSRVTTEKHMPVVGRKLNRVKAYFHNHE
jgi:hypothetical protein